MKHVLIIVIVAFLSMICLMIWYGNRFVTDRHTVGRYTYSPVKNESPMMSEKIILEGIPLALEHSRMNPKDWTVSPASRLQPARNLPLTNGKPVSTLIILTNQLDRTQLYVRVELASSNALNYHLYRPK